MIESDAEQPDEFRSVPVSEYFRDPSTAKFSQLAERTGGVLEELPDEGKYTIHYETGDAIDVKYPPVTARKHRSPMVSHQERGYNSGLYNKELIEDDDSATFVDVPWKSEDGSRVFTGVVFSRTEGVTEFKKVEGKHDIPPRIVTAGEKAAEAKRKQEEAWERKNSKR